MPAVKIEMGNKWKIETAVSVKNIVMNAVKNTLSLKSSDRNIRVIRYDQDLFELKDNYEIFIEIQMTSGRDIETKRELYRSIVQSLEEKTVFNRENIFIFINEQPAENWGVKGGIPLSDVK
ncbi:tautomerase family protein [Lachnospiraceae bacterium NSJ-143]|nr:tautomerase family protein [Lachnospiraceae bacterium NSJ-143]